MKLYYIFKKYIKNLIKIRKIFRVKIIIILILIFLLISIIKYKIIDIKKCLTSEKWIVMVSFNPPSSSIIELIKNNRSWKIVVIGNVQKNDIIWNNLNFSCKFVYLSIKDQIRLGYKTTNYLNFNSYSRKNIGYLYAIHHGAKEIYEIDEDIIIPNLNNLELTIINTYICYGIRNDSLMINPYLHFGEKSIWPRGFRISDIGKQDFNNFYMLNSS